MTQTTSSAEDNPMRLTAIDIRNAAAEGVLSSDAAERLVQWGDQRHAALFSNPTPSTAGTEQTKGLNLVTVAYYFGAMLMISACGWFLGDKWEVLGSKGILITSLIYAAITAGAGVWLRAKGYCVGGGLLITVAVCLTPLVIYSVEDLLGVWPGDRPGAYELLP